MEYNKNNKKIDEKGSEKILKTKAEQYKYFNKEIF